MSVRCSPAHWLVKVTHAALAHLSALSLEEGAQSFHQFVTVLRASAGNCPQPTGA